MPTKTNTPGSTEQLQGRLRELEQQRQRAAGANTLAKQRAEEIIARQQQIAVAVVAEEKTALSEEGQLAEALLIEGRRRATARSARDQLDAEIEEAKEALAAEQRRVHLDAFNRLAEDRHALEEEAEARMASLLHTLNELQRLDVRQRQQGLKAGRDNAHSEHPIRFMLAEWLGARLGGTDGYLDQSVIPGYTERSLPELDSLASASKQQHQGRGSVA